MSISIISIKEGDGQGMQHEWESRGMHLSSEWNPEGKRHLRRPGHTWMGNI
jgi:hypothetical protein